MMLRAVVAMLILFALLISVSACEDSSSELVGKWYAEIDVTDRVSEAMSVLEFTADNRINVFIELTFRADGKMSIDIDYEKSMESFDTFVNRFTEAGIRSVYQTFGRDGMTREFVDMFFKLRYRCTVEEFLRKYADTDIMPQFSSLMDTLSEYTVLEIDYRTQYNMLFLTDGLSTPSDFHVDFEVTGDTLLLTRDEAVPLYSVFSSLEDFLSLPLELPRANERTA